MSGPAKIGLLGRGTVGGAFQDLLAERQFLREGQWLRAKLESTAREIYRDSDIDAANRAKLRKITATIRNQTFLSGAQRLLEDGANAEDISDDLAELLQPCTCACPECETSDCRNCSAEEKCAECERIEELEDKCLLNYKNNKFSTRATQSVPVV